MKFSTKKILLPIVIIYLILVTAMYLYTPTNKYTFADDQTSNMDMTKKIHVNTIQQQTYDKYDHGSSVTANGNKIFITWYSGSNETNPDTNIMFSSAEKKAGVWEFDKIKSVMNREEFQSDTKKHIHHLGNSIIFHNGDKLWIFFSSSAGGWSTSSLNSIYSLDDGKTWSKPHTIISSPIFNFSSLTREAVVKLDNGYFAIPMYKEFNNLNGRWFILNREGELESVNEMTHTGVNLQPTVVPISDSHAIAYYRQMNSKTKRIYYNETFDTGKTWSESKATDIDNPDASIAAIGVKDGVLMAYNDQTNGRDNLSLSYRNFNSGKWKKLYTFPNKAKGELSYPSFIRFGDSIILSFSDKNAHTIRVVEITGENTK